MAIFSLVSPALSAFQDVIQTAGDVGAQLNLPSSPEEAKTARWSVWTYLPAIGAGALSVAQVIGCVAHAVLGNTPQAIFHGISAVVAAYAGICVASYVPLMSLEGYAKVLADKVRQMGKLITDLRQTNTELSTTVQTLDKDLSLQKKELIKKEKLIEETIDKLQKSIHELEAAEKKAENLQKLLDGFQKTTNDVSTKINQFVDLNKRLSCNSEELSKQLEEMRNVQQSMQLSLGDIDETQGALQHKKEEAEKLATDFHHTYYRILELLIQVKKEKEAIIAEINELKNNAGRLEQSVDKLHSVDQQLGERTTNVKKMVQDTNVLIERLKDVEQKIDQKKKQVQTPRQDQNPSPRTDTSSKQEQTVNKQ